MNTFCKSPYKYTNKMFNSRKAKNKLLVGGAIKLPSKDTFRAAKLSNRKMSRVIKFVLRKTTNTFIFRFLKTTNAQKLNSIYFTNPMGLTHILKFYFLQILKTFLWVKFSRKNPLNRLPQKLRYLYLL